MVNLLLVKDALAGKPIKRRHKDWPNLRDHVVLLHPFCAVCGGKKHLNVHHKLPFHLFPEKELDIENLIVLCEKSSRNINCHYVVGHLGLSWQHFNVSVDRDAKYLLNMFSQPGTVI